jgi:hypothetical protein
MATTSLHRAPTLTPAELHAMRRCAPLSGPARSVRLVERQAPVAQPPRDASCSRWAHALGVGPRA